VDALEAGFGEAVQGQGRGRAQDERDEGDRDGDDQGVSGGRPDLGLMEEALVPDEEKPFQPEPKREALKELTTRMTMGR
jgi:hypothetical protein